jgi:UDP-N-acetylglucosamine 3-dehydrogenase
MRVGVVGVGGHATANLYPCLAPAGLELVATCALHRDRADAAAVRWGAAHAFDSAESMLAAVDIDGVVVCVEPAAYAPIVRSCIEAGKPVFCDKPGAASSAEARELAELSSEKAVPVVVGYMKRFAPAYRRAREIIMSPSFGPVSLATFAFVMGPWPTGKVRQYLIDNPVHHLDLARYLLGELTDLDANVRITEAPDSGCAVAAMASASGAVCTLNFSTTGSWEHRSEYAEVFGAGHSVFVDNVDTCTYRPPEPPAQVWRPNYTVPSAANASHTLMGFLPELEHFRSVATEGAESLSDMASAGATLALAERLCEIAGV